MKDLETIKSCLGQHPAHRMPFDELYQGLMAEVAQGYIDRQVNDLLGLELFNYSRLTTTEDHHTIFTMIARGLILCPSQKKVVCTPLPRFFNYGEVLWLPEREKFEVTSKMDGSCLFAWFWKNEWRTSTRGSFASDQAIWARDWLEKHVETDELIPGQTYIFEVIYPENRIVVGYDFEGLVLLTIFNESGYEIPYDNVKIIAKALAVRITECLEFSSIEEMLELAKTLSSNEEGWVVRFECGYRLKIKGDEYCRIHRIISNCTPLAVWDMLRVNGDVKSLADQLPEEFAKDLLDIEEILSVAEKTLLTQIEALHKQYSHLSDKKLGLELSEISQFSKLSGFLFPCRKRNFLEEAKKPGKLRDLLYNFFRPTNNVLDGYVPRSSIHKFSEVE